MQRLYIEADGGLAKLSNLSITLAAIGWSVQYTGSISVLASGVGERHRRAASASGIGEQNIWAVRV